MKKRVAVLAMIGVVVLVSGAILSPQQQAQQAGVALLRQDARGPVELVQSPQTGTPSFIRMRIPVSALGLGPADTSVVAVGYGFLGRYAALMGIAQARDQLQPGLTSTDDLGMRHVTLNQAYEQVPVYGGSVRLHLSRDGRTIVAIGNGFVPRIALRSAQPAIGAERIVSVAREAMPRGIVSSPTLAVYPGVPVGRAAKLAWLVEARDDSIPARNLYVIDAQNGDVIDVLDRLYTARDRRTYDAAHTTTLPGTLKRSEATPAVGDADVDSAHAFAGATYDYYHSTFGRDSYDGAGATLVSTAHYGTNYQNAGWNGVQMLYGDGFPVKDVAAHELTHAVTERTAALEYRWQSGALNESISDIFGAMVDRDDWLMGEDLPIGAIRDLQDPTHFGDPAHTRDWVKTCADNQGVHTNSGIPNKAFYNIATAVGKDKAERIFYRALVTYLQATSSLEDARAAALQAAEDLYGASGAEYLAVASGFDAVGLDGVWQPPTNNCAPTCPIRRLLSDRSVSGGDESARAIVNTLHRFRDNVLSRTAVGRRYRALFERHSVEIGYVVLRDAELRAAAGRILRETEPGLARLADGRGDEMRLTAGVVNDIRTFLSQVAMRSRDRGAKRLAADLESEMDGVDWQRLAGMSFAQAWGRISSDPSERMWVAGRE